MYKKNREGFFGGCAKITQSSTKRSGHRNSEVKVLVGVSKLLVT
jgi:hypothetical protein